jgi:hypothetical protein
VANQRHLTKVSIIIELAGKRSQNQDVIPFAARIKLEKMKPQESNKLGAVKFMLVVILHSPLPI